MEFELELSAETVFQWILTFSRHWQWQWHVRMGKEWLDEARVDEQSGTIKNSTTKALPQSFDNQNTRKQFWILDKFELWICRVVQSWDRWSNSLSGSIPIAARSAWQCGGATKYQPGPKYRGGHILLAHRQGPLSTYHNFVFTTLTRALIKRNIQWMRHFSFLHLDPASLTTWSFAVELIN